MIAPADVHGREKGKMRETSGKKREKLFDGIWQLMKAADLG